MKTNKRPTNDESKPEGKTVTIKLDVEQAKRFDQLEAKLRGDPRHQFFRVDTAYVVRLVLGLGMRKLEEMDEPPVPPKEDASS